MTTKNADFQPNDQRTRSYFRRLVDAMGTGKAEREDIAPSAATAVLMALLEDNDAAPVDPAYIPRQFTLFEDWLLWSVADGKYHLLPAVDELLAERPYVHLVAAERPFGVVHRIGNDLVLSRTQRDWYLALLTERGRRCEVSRSWAWALLTAFIAALGSAGPGEAQGILRAFERDYELELCPGNDDHGYAAYHVRRFSLEVAARTTLPLALTGAIVIPAGRERR